MNRRHLTYLLAHLAFVALAIAYVWACNAVATAAIA